jgi:hypothetical protein
VYAPPYVTVVGLKLPLKLGVSVQLEALSTHLLPSQEVPDAQVAVAVAEASGTELLFKKKVLEL